MSDTPIRPHRKSIRIPGFDYSAGSAYFVTICTDRKQCVFGSITNDEFRPNDLGELVQTCWDDIPSHSPGVELDAFVVMPNHVHAVLFLHGSGKRILATQASPLQESAPPQAMRATQASPLRESTRATGPAAGSLGAVIGSFKSAVSRRMRQAGISGPATLWQRNYFEHVVRSERSLDAIRDYVVTNPLRWGLDSENPMGNGADDVERWVRSNEMTVAGSEGGTHEKVTQASPLQKTAPLGKTRATQASPLRIGHGYDFHRLQPGGKLVLAGVEVSDAMSPIAHSDGDVVFHAVVDAILGALGDGDIGEHFPDTDSRWKGAASHVFVRESVRRANAAGMRVVNVDVTILAERPKLKKFKPAMVESLSKLLDAPANIKAGTNEGCDAIGRGEAIAAHAVVLLSRDS